jgi:hypothetical protein
MARNAILIIFTVLLGCDTVSPQAQNNAFEIFRTNVSFEETVVAFKKLMAERSTLVRMTRTGSCFEFPEKRRDRWVMVCGHSLGGNSKLSDSSFAFHKWVIVDKAGSNVEIRMTPAPHLLMGEYTPSNLEILRVAQIQADFDRREFRPTKSN